MVALDSVANVAAVRADTRYLLKKGMDCLQTNPRPAIKALINAAGLTGKPLSTEDIDFSIEPKLHALWTDWMMGSVRRWLVLPAIKRLPVCSC